MDTEYGDGGLLKEQLMVSNMKNLALFPCLFLSHLHAITLADLT
jgi:hypothetical protein